MIDCLVFLLEELSAKAMLEGVVSRLVDARLAIHYMTFDGKQDLERNLERKIRLWKRPNTAFVVMRDQDSGDCREVKRRLKDICSRTGKEPILVRIACHELESFYLGDLDAVGRAYGISVPAQQSRKYRHPDDLGNAAEEMRKLTRHVYQKIDGSRRIGPLLKLDGSNASVSFNALCEGIRRLVETL